MTFCQNLALLPSHLIFILSDALAGANHPQPRSYQQKNLHRTHDSNLLIENSRKISGKKPKAKHTAAGIPTWSPTVVLICRSTAYVWQSGRDAQFSADSGRMCLISRFSRKYTSVSMVEERSDCVADILLQANSKPKRQKSVGIMVNMRTRDRVSAWFLLHLQSDIILNKRENQVFICDSQVARPCSLDSLPTLQSVCTMIPFT